MTGWKKKSLAKVKTTKHERKNSIPDGLWVNCPKCKIVIYYPQLKENQHVCPSCNYHERLSARERLLLICDNGDFEELFCTLNSKDPLKFSDSKKYHDRLEQAVINSEEKEALLVIRGKIEEQPAIIAAFEFQFMGGSMGTVVGEKFLKAVEAAIHDQSPLICFTASGGARMQEGLFSLMQMAKTAAALNQLSAAKLLFISVLTDPTMGGVSASLAMLGDIIIAEPHALIGFAGQRVIEQTVRQKLPSGFQRSEFLLKHGAIDAVVDRRELKTYLGKLLRKFQRSFT